MKKDKRKRNKAYIFFLAVITLSVYLYFSSNKLLESLACESFHSAISSASYNAIYDVLEEGYDYKSLINVSKDANGNINMVITDSLKVNSIASSLASKAYKYLDKSANYGVDVPLGAFTGIKLISGFGKKIKMKLISVSSVKCEMVSNFAHAGINQTRHTLTVNVLCTVSIVTKTSTKIVSDKISVMVFDNLIIGKVPQIYLNSQIIGSSDEN